MMTVYCPEHGECKLKIDQCYKIHLELCEKYSALEDKINTQDKEYIKKFAELTTQISVLEKDIKQLSTQIKDSDTRQYQIMLSMNEQLKEHARWMRQRVAQEAGSIENIAKQNISNKEEAAKHKRETVTSVLGWTTAAIAALWAIYRELLLRVN